MASSLRYALVFVLALCMSSDASEECSASAGSAFNFSVVSRRNNTGHWTVTVTAESDARMQTSEGNSTREIGVNVEQETVPCQGREKIQLRGEATVWSPTLLTDEVRVPPEGYEKINNLGYYKINTTVATWETANSTCEREGAHLIIINSEEEAAVVKELFQRRGSNLSSSNDNLCFIGFHDRFTEGQYVTVRGEPLSSTGYARWYSNEPNGGASENCGTIYKDMSLVTTDCNAKLFFICEFYI